MNQPPKTVTPLYLEDIEPGKSFVSGSYTVGEAEMIDFARKFDPQPFHTDPAAARTSFFNGLVASGWYTAGITMRLLVEGGIPIATGLIGMEGQMSWPNPVRPGDTLHAESSVMDVTPSKSRPDRGIVTVRSATFNQKGETVQIMISKILVFRRANAP